ncbi:MAG: tryptophan--tRNA ligase [Peptococcaceae bacterium]|nr:tryptophan--tRNA ligase [Peptococcaceae bacterium]
MSEKKGIILSGMRPTGLLHIGHLSVLENWAALQKDYQCYYMVADWHALTSDYDDTSRLPAQREMMLLDWLAAGLEPENAVMFVQSGVKAHAELSLLLGMNMPLAWLERVPTYKDQIEQLGKQGKDIRTYGFLGYPLLMAADILVYRANLVPVGEDQGAHLEFSRELVRRFHHLYGREIFPEPLPLYAKIPSLPGTDGRKMSKSYHNDIPLSAPPALVTEKVKTMITDPARIRKTDLGHPEICSVSRYQSIYNEGQAAEIQSACRSGQIGCAECKKRLTERLNQKLAPILERRERYSQNPGWLREICADGNAKAGQAAAATMELVRAAMNL